MRYKKGITKYRILDIRNAVFKKDGILLTEKLDSDYIYAKEYLNVMCKNGHNFHSRVDRLIGKCWCLKCARTQRYNYTIDFLKWLARKNVGKCLSEKYIGSKKKYLWECNLGHKWKTRAVNVLHGTWCPICGRKRAGEAKRIHGRYAKK